MERKNERNAKGNTKALVPLSTRAQRGESTSYFEHLQRWWLNNSHIQVLVILLFSNPTHKTKIGIANRWGDATNTKLQPIYTNQTI
jgi:hypothetical protein